MEFKIVFEISGDELPLIAAYPDLVEYYVDFLEKNQINKFNNTNFYEDISEKIEELSDAIQETNSRLVNIIDPILINDKEKLINQEFLNALHEKWVLFQPQLVNINELYNSPETNQKKIGEILHHWYPDDIHTITKGEMLTAIDFRKIYDKINLRIHDIEDIFYNIEFVTSNWVKTANIFPKKYISNNIFNLNIAFNHLGRTQYNKFLHWDHDLIYKDENSFNELLGCVELKLQPPQTIDYSIEYKKWCNKHKVIPTGNYLNLGNLINLGDNLWDYRKIVYRNLKYNRSFSLKI
jgi:hypothetical protein